jgi:hypothetical protein
VSDLGALSIGFVLGLAVVGAVLLRNEEEVKKAWRRRRGIVEPKGLSADINSNAAPVRRGVVVGMGLLAIAYIGLAIASGDIFYIILAALYSLVFGAYLLKYRRSRSPT